MNGAWRTDTTLYTFFALKRATLSSISALTKSNADGTPECQVPTSLLNKAEDSLVEKVLVMLPVNQAVVHCFVKVDVECEARMTLAIADEVSLSPHIIKSGHLHCGHQVQTSLYWLITTELAALGVGHLRPAAV